MKNNKYRRILYLKDAELSASKNAVPLSDRDCPSNNNGKEFK